MASSSFSDSSEDDRDESFDEDMEALKRACVLTGKNPNEIEPPSASAASESDAESDEIDDMELVRRIQQRYSFPSDVLPLPVSKFAKSHGPGDSDGEDDFETLRAIQRRFSHYDRDGLMNTENNLQKDTLVCTTSLTSERDTSSILLNTSNGETLGKEFPDSGDNIVNSQLSNICDISPGSRPSDLTEFNQEEDRACKLPVMSPGNASFPKFAQMFIAAIKKNRSCQKFMRSKLIQIEARIEENKELKERVKCLMNFQVSCKRKAGKLLSQRKDPRIKLISLPKAKIPNSAKVKEKKVTASCLGPAENSHVPNYRMVLTKFAVSLSRQQWSKIEKENLAKGIKQQFQEVLLQKSMEQYSDSEGSPGDCNDLDNIIASITELEITPENIRCFLPQVDWERLASMYVMGRSGAECETRWLNHEDPLINPNPWMNLEDKNLLFIVQQRGIYNWIEIATSMGRSRTPFQCLTRYQRSLNAYILKREWTEDEDAQLRAVVETLGEGDWQTVANTLGGRTGPQCSNRWRKSLHPSRQRVGRWSVEEDKRLKISVMLFGPKSWNKIAEFVPGRTQVQCRERWFNTLDPSLNLGQWTEEEDYKLKEAITEHGHCWSKIAACVTRRTDNQCRRRWKVLFPHEVPLLQAARKIQRVALMSNFVDREDQRPALGPCDFVSASLEKNSPSEAGNKNSKAKRRKRSLNDPQPSSSKKSRTKAKVSSRATDGDDVVTSHGDDSNSIPKKRTKKKAPKAHPGGTKCVELAEADKDLPHPENAILSTVDNGGNSMLNDVSQESKFKRSRTKCKVPFQKEVAEVMYDAVVTSHGDIGNSIPKKRTKKKQPKAHPNGIKFVEPAETYRDLRNPDNAILSAVDNDASIDGTSGLKDVTRESKFKRSTKKCKTSQKDIAEVEYDDDAILASVVCDIVKRRRLKLASTEIVPEEAVLASVFCDIVKRRRVKLASTEKRDTHNQPAEEDSILKIVDSSSGSVLHETPSIDDISQQDTMNKSRTKGKTSHQENSTRIDVTDSSFVDQAVGTSGKSNTISRKQEKKACKSVWSDKRVHPVKDCEALPLVGQSISEIVDISGAILLGSDASIEPSTLETMVSFGKHKREAHKISEIVSEISLRCCNVEDGEEPHATHETTILMKDYEAQSCDGQTIQQVLLCNINLNLPDRVSTLSSQVTDTDRRADDDCVPPFSDSNGGLDNSFHIAAHETAILIKDCEAQSRDGLTLQQALPCNINPNLPDKVSTLFSQVTDVDRRVDDDCVHPFSDSNGGLDNSFHIDGGMLIGNLDIFPSHELKGYFSFS